ncbi:tetratricopeptide repeat protein [Sphingobacterium allocomposti]|uniref:Tetratricopeptide repeat protein n=1 Tax=Sphingobacterium allocomposti TaxID=415956 RepID=A0A5S5CY78_9SPHI|nr:tetratricopeptide repeat protein [Sphingobacterium composti Yoo et al. 2007 non Ten et al. 2007]TYP87826.1 tetratricopeptide repeat protein [Sphingobacterium composti Yoo et al. 2007 non Ten et al. 2007]
MLKNFGYAKLLVALCAAMCCYQPVYAQRAGTTIERNKDAREINGLYQRGLWEEGKRRAEEVLKKNAKDSDMRMLVGKYYLHKQEYDRARYELVKSLEYAPANVESKHMLVTVETETRRYSSAICYINELLEVNPYWKGLWRKKIELYRAMGNHVEADRLLKRISQIYPEDSELKEDQMYILEQQTASLNKAGRIDESIAAAKKLVNDQPAQEEGYILLIDQLIKAGNYSDALAYTERGLNRFPADARFVQKKVAILEQAGRYPEILAFLEGQMKRRGAVGLRGQYNYFVLEAARSAKRNDPASLYGRIFEHSPGNREAFDAVFKACIANGQYEEALHALDRHRQQVGRSKELDMRELSLYKRMGHEAKVAGLTEAYFIMYPDDADLRASYVSLAIKRAQTYVQEGRTTLAIDSWREALQYGDAEAVSVAQRGLYNTYVSAGKYGEAIAALDVMLSAAPGDAELLLKKADLYAKQGRHEHALATYEQVLKTASADDRERWIVSYNEMTAARVKKLREDYKFAEARELCSRWLAIDGHNPEPFVHIINACYQLKDYSAMLYYAQTAADRFADEVSFKIKLAEAMNHVNGRFADSWGLLHGQIRQRPYHEPLINTFHITTEQYAGILLKEKQHAEALTVVDTALLYKSDNRTLKYMKGLAYEGLKQFDSAYYYQSFYEPSLLEHADFRSHLNYLGQRSLRNNIGVSHLRARFGDDYRISSISTVEYTRMGRSGAYYGARINYAGREQGKGIQGQVEWGTPWTERWSTRIDLAVANQFFARLAANAAATYAWNDFWEAEAGVGYRAFFTDQRLMNLNLGLTKQIDDFRVSAKLSNFFLDSRGENFHLYSLGARAQYFMDSPRNYLLAVGSIGNSPDIDLLDNQLYNSFNVFNAMVGAGAGRAITRNVGASIMGTWYNFQVEGAGLQRTYRNLYNLYFQFYVSF